MCPSVGRTDGLLPAAQVSLKVFEAHALRWMFVSHLGFGVWCCFWLWLLSFLLLFFFFFFILPDWDEVALWKLQARQGNG